MISRLRYSCRPMRKLVQLLFIILLLSCLSSLVFFRYSVRVRILGDRHNQRHQRNVARRRSLLLQHVASNYMEAFEDTPDATNMRAPGKSIREKGCSMRTCFDFSLCERGFKVYVYPQRQGEKTSILYSKILRALKESKYHTLDPKEACLFVVSVDTLDRDRLSPDYVHGLAAKIRSLPLWNGGRNHLLFNVYSGTWPEYSQALDFNFGSAMLARASVSSDVMRPDFDVSIPLIPKSHPEKGGRAGSLNENGRMFPMKKYLLAFKGKRYLTGIGSETRNALSLIHDGDKTIMVTTCRHGKGWEKHKDEKCDEDQIKFDSYDYRDLLEKSTFCLVPRGRRLGSFRFLETLEANCIPISLSNGYALPLAEKIDWKRAIIEIDERLVLQLPQIVRSISPSKILAMRQQLQFLWNAYFSSVDKVVSSVLETIQDRVLQHKSHDYYAWNLPPGALIADALYSPWLSTMPFYSRLGLGSPAAEEFTAVIVAYTAVTKASSPLFNLIREIGKCRGLVKVLVLWMCDTMPPKPIQWPSIPVPTDVEVLEGKDKVVSSRYNVAHKVNTDAILMLDEDTLLIQDEVEFAFSVWLSHSDRIIGFPARNHYWDSNKSRWSYTSKWSNEYSLILTAAAFIHRFYCHLYTTHLPTSIRNFVDQTSNCDDIAMNFLVSHVTRKPPVKVTQKKQYWDSVSQESSQRMVQWMNPQHFAQRQTCMNMFANVFGYMPLIQSQFRYDPVLFKDPVAMLKKKYRRLDLL